MRTAGWIFCGVITALVLIARHWTTIAPWATRPIYGRTRAWAYVKSHKRLLVAAVVSGPLGWLVSASVGVAAGIVDRIGKNGGFQSDAGVISGKNVIFIALINYATVRCERRLKILRRATARGDRN